MKNIYRKFRIISRDFFPHFQPCGLYSAMIYVVILYFFFLKLPGNVLGAAYNQVLLIVWNLRYSIWQVIESSGQSNRMLS